LVYTSEYVTLVIQDDGKGFDPNEHHQGLGLRSMRERAELLNGEFSIESEIGKGTCIEVKLYN
jgi:signal transduction histidine kinase